MNISQGNAMTDMSIYPLTEIKPPSISPIVKRGCQGKVFKRGD